MSQRTAARIAIVLSYACFLALGAMAVWGRDIATWVQAMG